MTALYTCGHPTVLSFEDPSGPCPSCATTAWHRAREADARLRPRTIEYSCGHMALVDATAEDAATLAGGICRHCTDRTADPERYAADEAAAERMIEQARIALVGTPAEQAAYYGPPRYHYDDEFGVWDQVGGYRGPGISTTPEAAE